MRACSAAWPAQREDLSSAPRRTRACRTLSLDHPHEVNRTGLFGVWEKLNNAVTACKKGVASATNKRKRDAKKNPRCCSGRGGVKINRAASRSTQICAASVPCSLSFWAIWIWIARAAPAAVRARPGPRRHSGSSRGRGRGSASASGSRVVRARGSGCGWTAEHTKQETGEAA